MTINSSFETKWQTLCNNNTTKEDIKIFAVDNNLIEDTKTSFKEFFGNSLKKITKNEMCNRIQLYFDNELSQYNIHDNKKCYTDTDIISNEWKRGNIFTLPHPNSDIVWCFSYDDLIGVLDNTPYQNPYNRALFTPKEVAKIKDFINKINSNPNVFKYETVITNIPERQITSSEILADELSKFQNYINVETIRKQNQTRVLSGLVYTNIFTFNEAKNNFIPNDFYDNPEDANRASIERICKILLEKGINKNNAFMILAVFGFVENTNFPILTFDNHEQYIMIMKDLIKMTIISDDNLKRRHLLRLMNTYRVDNTYVNMIIDRLQNQPIVSFKNMNIRVIFNSFFNYNILDFYYDKNGNASYIKYIINNTVVVRKIHSDDNYTYFYYNDLPIIIVKNKDHKFTSNNINNFFTQLPDNLENIFFDINGKPTMYIENEQKFNIIYSFQDTFWSFKTPYGDFHLEFNTNDFIIYKNKDSAIQIYHILLDEYFIADNETLTFRINENMAVQVFENDIITNLENMFIVFFVYKNNTLEPFFIKHVNTQETKYIQRINDSFFIKFDNMIIDISSTIFSVQPSINIQNIPDNWNVVYTSIGFPSYIVSPNNEIVVIKERHIDGKKYQFYFGEEETIIGEGEFECKYHAVLFGTE